MLSRFEHNEIRKIENLWDIGSIWYAAPVPVQFIRLLYYFVNVLGQLGILYTVDHLN